MEDDRTVLNQFMRRTYNSMVQDARQKNIKVPSGFRLDADKEHVALIVPGHFKFLIYGRAPGKAPPPIAMEEWIEKNPDVLSRLQSIWKYIQKKSAAYIVGQKIAREGTDIYKGKKPGIDLVGSIKENMPWLLQHLARNQAVTVAQALIRSIKGTNLNPDARNA